MIQTYLIAGVVAIALGFTTGWKVHSWKTDAAQARANAAAAQLARDMAKKVDRAAENYEAARASAAARDVVVTKEVYRVVSKPVYRNVCLDSDGVRILADDAAASNARRGLKAAVPAASNPR